MYSKIITQSNHSNEMRLNQERAPVKVNENFAARMLQNSIWYECKAFYF